MPSRTFASVLVAGALVCAVPVEGGGLATLLIDLYGPGGLFVDSEAPLPDGSDHSAHFNSAFQAEFRQFNIALGSALSTLPIPSPASGFTYVFDPTTGEFTRSSRSFGPIMSERAETIGKGQKAVGFNYQYFSFDEIEGLDLGAIPAVFTHDDASPGGRADVVSTMNAIEVNIGQATAFFGFGLSNRIDLSIAVPVIDTELAVESLATVQRLGTGSDLAVHFYDEGEVHLGSQRLFSASGTASGLGDVVVRLKGAVKGGERAGLALGLDLRLPTGDEEDLLGSGAEGIKPFLAASFSAGRVSPHVNLAYQWNGDSVLAGDVATGEKADLPDQLFFVVGADFAVSSKLTVAVDLLTLRVIDSPRLERATFVGLDEPGSTFDDIAFTTESFTETSAALGFKVNPVGKLLVDFNLLFALNDSGLRDDLTSLLGLEYFF